MINLHQSTFHITGSRRGIHLITEPISEMVSQSFIHSGTCNVFLPHTSASLIFCQNADPEVRQDLEKFMSRLAPDGDRLFQHVTEGPDDMPAHVRSVLTQNSLTIPLHKGKLMLGTWQGIYLWEHRIEPHDRQVIVTVMGSDKL